MILQTLAELAIGSVRIAETPEISKKGGCSSLKNCVCDTKCAPISDRELFEIPEIILSM